MIEGCQLPATGSSRRHHQPSLCARGWSTCFYVNLWGVSFWASSVLGDLGAVLCPSPTAKCFRKISAVFQARCCHRSRGHMYCGVKKKTCRHTRDDWICIHFSSLSSIESNVQVCADRRKIIKQCFFKFYPWSVCILVGTRVAGSRFCSAWERRNVFAETWEVCLYELPWQ